MGTDTYLDDGQRTDPYAPTPHRYDPVVYDTTWGSLECGECGQRGRTLGDAHTCDTCGQPMAAGEVNTSEVVAGWHHGRCLTVREDQERFTISDMRWVDRGHALALQREAGDGDL